MAVEIELRPFQVKAMAQYRQSWNLSSSHMGVAPTAFGKSIVMGWLASHLCPKGWLMVIIAHREGLVDQNAKKVLMVDPTLRVGREIGSEHADIKSVDVVSASIATLHRKRAEGFVRELKATGRQIFLVTDEAHHAAASTYRAFIETLQPDRHLGVTATPFRADDEDLTEIFPAIGFNVSRGEMIDDGWLARPGHFRVSSGQSLAAVKSRMGEYVEADLLRTLDVVDRNELIMNAADEACEVLKHPPYNQPVARGVTFCINLKHVESLAELYRARGWETYVIVGKTKPDDRRYADYRLKTASERVMLLSCGVLTEGWDVEECNLGIFARPTKSGVLMDQMIGRVMRFLVEKPYSLMLDIGDKDDLDRISLARVFDVPHGWNAEGRCLREDQKWFSETCFSLPLKLQSELWKCETRRDVQRVIADRINMAGKRLERDYEWWDLGNECRAVIGNGTVVMYRSPQGLYIAEWRLGTTRTKIEQGKSATSVLSAAEMWIDCEFPIESRFLRSRETYVPPSDKQLAFLDKLHIEYPKDITRKGASQLISQHRMEKNSTLEKGIMAFGKFKGVHVSEVPTSYIHFMIEKNSDWLSNRPEGKMFTDELSRRSNSLV